MESLAHRLQAARPHANLNNTVQTVVERSGVPTSILLSGPNCSVSWQSPDSVAVRSCTSTQYSRTVL